MTFTTRIVVVCFSDLALARLSHQFARENGDICVPEFRGGVPREGNREPPVTEPLARMEATAGPALRRGIGPAVFATVPSEDGGGPHRSDWIGLGEAALSVVHGLGSLSHGQDGALGQINQQVTERDWRGHALSLGEALDDSGPADVPSALAGRLPDLTGLTRSEAVINTPLGGGLAPQQGRRQTDVASVEPRFLASLMAVPALLDAAGPAPLEISRDPTALIWREVQPEMSPSVRAFRVLENTAVGADGFQCSRKAAIVIAQRETRPGCRGTAPVPAPAFAGWMRHDRIRPGVLASITGLVPRVHVRKTEVDTIRLDEQGGDHLAHQNP